MLIHKIIGIIALVCTFQGLFFAFSSQLVRFFVRSWICVCTWLALPGVSPCEAPPVVPELKANGCLEADAPKAPALKVNLSFPASLLVFIPPDDGCTYVCLDPPPIPLPPPMPDLNARGAATVELNDFFSWTGALLLSFETEFPLFLISWNLLLIS